MEYIQKGPDSKKVQSMLGDHETAVIFSKIQRISTESKSTQEFGERVHKYMTSLPDGNEKIALQEFVKLYTPATQAGVITDKNWKDATAIDSEYIDQYIEVVEAPAKEDPKPTGAKDNGGSGGRV
jgi:hypothetical protein